MTQLEDLTLNMLGGKPWEIGSFKAVETKYLIVFFDDFLSRLGRTFVHCQLKHYLEAVHSLHEMSDIMYEGPSILKASHVQALHDYFNRYTVAAAAAEVPSRPKHHLMAHQISRSEEEGNPRDYACFEDEGLNAVIKAIGQVAHRSVWEYRVFSNFDLYESGQAPKRARVE